MNAIQIADSFDLFAVDHTPDGWPAVQQKQLTEAALMLRKQHEAIVNLRETLRELSCMYVVHHEAATRAKQALADTEELVK